jgi:hypothetical protein
MIHRYVRDNVHELTIMQVVLYDQMYIFIVSLGPNVFGDQCNHA